MAVAATTLGLPHARLLLGRFVPTILHTALDGLARSTRVRRHVSGRRPRLRDATIMVELLDELFHPVARVPPDLFEGLGMASEALEQRWIGGLCVGAARDQKRKDRRARSDSSKPLSWR